MVGGGTWGGRKCQRDLQLQNDLRVSRLMQYDELLFYELWHGLLNIRTDLLPFPQLKTRPKLYYMYLFLELFSSNV